MLPDTLQSQLVNAVVLQSKQNIHTLVSAEDLAVSKYVQEVPQDAASPANTSLEH
jgi:hypothetical protein